MCWMHQPCGNQQCYAVPACQIRNATGCLPRPQAPWAQQLLCMQGRRSARIAGAASLSATFVCHWLAFTELKARGTSTLMACRGCLTSCQSCANSAAGKQKLRPSTQHQSAALHVHLLVADASHTKHQCTCMLCIWSLKSSAARMLEYEAATCRFVVKTTDDTGRKVFINMCSSNKVAAPAAWANGVMPDNVKQSLENLGERQDIAEQAAEGLRLPLSLSEQRDELDKHGQPCSVFDCVFSDMVMKQAAQMRSMKIFVVETVLGWVSHKHKVKLDQRFKLPKLKYKGDTVQEHCIRKDPKKLVTEITELEEVDEEPSLALRSNPIPAEKRAPLVACIGALCELRTLDFVALDVYWYQGSALSHMCSCTSLDMFLHAMQGRRWPKQLPRCRQQDRQANWLCKQALVQKAYQLLHQRQLSPSSPKLLQRCKSWQHSS